MDVRSPASTRLPITAASRRTSIVASSSRSSRAINTSRRDDGSGPLPSSASSSSTWNGFPSASATTRAASAASTVTPAIAATWAMTAASSSATSRTWSRVACRSSPARTGVRGCRRWSSSERKASTRVTPVRARRRARKVTTSSVERSAQWRSSMTATTSASAAIRASRSPSRRNCAERPGAASPTEASARPPNRSWMLAASAPTLATLVCETRPATRGSGGRGASRRPRGSRHGGPEPVAGPADLRLPNPASSAISRLLPIPASPLTSTTTRSLVRAAAVAARSRSRSSSRPMSVGLDPRVIAASWSTRWVRVTPRPHRRQPQGSRQRNRDHRRLAA